MSQITLGGQAVNTIGNLPALKTKAAAFTLVKQDLSELSLSDLKGKNIVLNIFPSLDTSTCAASVRRFNKEAAGLANTVVLAVSADLPFAAGRFCTAEGIENVVPVSVFRNQSFGKDYGVALVDGPLKGLLARSLVVINPEGEVLFTELVSEITNEPNYEAALAVLK